MKLKLKKYVKIQLYCIRFDIFRFLKCQIISILKKYFTIRQIFMKFNKHDIKIHDTIANM